MDILRKPMSKSGVSRTYVENCQRVLNLFANAKSVIGSFLQVNAASKDVILHFKGDIVNRINEHAVTQNKIRGYV